MIEVHIYFYSLQDDPNTQRNNTLEHQDLKVAAFMSNLSSAHQIEERGTPTGTGAKKATKQSRGIGSKISKRTREAWFV